jgi:serine/threonine-protein kinase
MPTRPKPDGLVAGRYRLGALLGEGAVAHVYEAEHVTLGRRVAMKILSARRAAHVPRLLAEARLVAALNHPNVCDIIDVGEDDDVGPFIVLELLLGETLAARVRRASLSPSEASDVFGQILSAVDAIHAAGIVHRDLKPDNVLLARRAGCAPLVKLIDFGFAKDVAAARSTVITQRGFVCGTPTYMAPEQLVGERASERTDLYAVGVMLFEALTGRHPFETARGSSFLPASLGRVCARALASDPAERFPSALAMQRALARAVTPTMRRRDTDTDAIVTVRAP